MQQQQMMPKVMTININQPQTISSREDNPMPKKKTKWWIWLIISLVIIGVGIAYFTGTI